MLVSEIVSQRETWPYMVCTSYSVVAVIGLSRASGKCVSLLCPIDLKKIYRDFYVNSVWIKESFTKFNSNQRDTFRGILLMKVIPRYLGVVGASLSDTKRYTALNQTVLSIQSWKLCCFFSSGFWRWILRAWTFRSWYAPVQGYPQAWILRCVFKWDLEAPAKILSCSHRGSSLFMVWILTPSYHCKQLHADTHSARSCAHSCMHKVRLALKTWLQVCAHVGGQQRASQDSHTDPRSAAPPPAWLVVARVLPPAVCQQAG